MINREDIKSDYLYLPNSHPVRVQIVKDYEKIVKEKERNNGSKFQYNTYNFMVKVLSGDDKGEDKKFTVFDKHLRKMVRLADDKTSKKVNTLVGSVFDITRTITDEGDGDKDYDTTFEIVSGPSGSVEDSAEKVSST